MLQNSVQNQKIRQVLCVLLCAFLSLAFRSGVEEGSITISGKVTDAQSNKPLIGANIIVPNTTVGTTTDKEGRFELKVPETANIVLVSFIGYQVQKIQVGPAHKSLQISLEPTSIDLQPVVVSAGREQQARSEAPISIASIDARQMDELKPDMLYQALNKVAGVNMVDLGQEQHMMAIRQPISTKAFFLYLEDGIPIRPTGNFNHNSIYEINMTGLERVEVIKGPASSIHGSNAIGGAINFITPKPSTVSTGKLSLRRSDIGYNRVDGAFSTTTNSGLGLYAGGYVAMQRNGWRDHSDFDKISFTARADYAFSEKTSFVTTFSTNHLDADMTGALDSTSFYGQEYSSLHTFTFRKVHATRWRATLSQAWNALGKTDFTLFFRNNSTLQNPAYRVRNVRGSSTAATGEDNDNSYNSFGANVQHRQYFGPKASLLTGVSMDLTPSSYEAFFIEIARDPNSGVYTGFTMTDSLLTNYEVDMFNLAAYSQLDYSATDKLKLVASLRVDKLDYDYDNFLPPSAFSGAPDEKNGFTRVSPKVGLTYDFGLGRGFYANFSQGFQPPEVGELYRGVKVPVLKPAYFNNYEAGGWMAMASGKVLIEATVYQMDGENEIITVDLEDGSTANANAGQTRHKGIEYAVTFSPNRNISFNVGGTNTRHDYLEFVTSTGDFSNKEMDLAPRMVLNAGVTLRPAFLKGSMLNVEWQHVGNYYMDPANTMEYGGYNILNLRLAFKAAGLEFWSTVFNVTDELFSTRSALERFGQRYQPGQPRHISFGVGYDL